MDIHQTLKNLVEKERFFTYQILKKLNELEQSRLFCQLGYSSLFDYCLHELKYSNDQAFRRIAAARLLKSLPEITPKVQSGELNLSHLSKVNTLFNHVEMNHEDKLGLISKIEGKSNRDSEKIIRAIAPTPVKIIEKIKPVQKNLSEVKFFADDELLEKIEKVKQLLNKDKLDQLLNKLCDEAIAQAKSKQLSKNLETTLNVQKESVENNSRYIPVLVKRQVNSKAEHRCEFIGTNGKRCVKTTQLEFAHKIPFACGGRTTPDNLQLFCKAHNLYDGIQFFGLKKMQRYFKTS